MWRDLDARTQPGPRRRGPTTTSGAPDVRSDQPTDNRGGHERADVHFIHVKAPHEDALPLILTHGWPGSIIEMLEAIGPLTDPTAHGGVAEDAFDLVVPSIPGYAFSAEPTELGWSAGRVAEAGGS